ncbi:MAG: tRNA1(Val) (adenine(37)-N6)-methyltransferase [Clostridia bacterium]|nr:tRNA1(Val) (adenine(37)-N6)-methyltransferase [Clostridia bacterium]
MVTILGVIMRRLDDLELNGLKLIQDTDMFCFGIDAVMLANFVNCKKGAKIIDLCTGNGVIPILLSEKVPAEEILGVEIQPKVAELAEENVKLNRLEDKIRILNQDLKTVSDALGKSVADVVTCNPPYRTNGCGIQNEADTKAIARHEIYCSLEDVIRVSAELLKPLGKFFMVHRPDRLCDILCCMRDYKIEPKVLQFVQHDKASAPTHILVEGVYGAKRYLKVRETKLIEDI